MPASAALAASALGLWSPKPHSHGVFSVTGRLAQGVAAGLLLFDGIGAFGERHPAAPALSEFNLLTFDGLASALTAGALTNTIELIGAALVFLTAGPCIARFFGLALAVGFAGLHMSGVAGPEIANAANAVIERSAAAARAFADPTLVKPSA